MTQEEKNEFKIDLRDIDWNLGVKVYMYGL